MDNENIKAKQNSDQNNENQQRLDFYKLHYPNRKSPRSVSKASNKMRSKSVVSVLQNSHNDETELYSPKGSIRKLAAERQLRKDVRSYSMFDKDKKKQNIAYKETISFKTALSGRSIKRNLNEVKLPINNVREVEDFAKKNLNVRLALQKARDEKIKMNKIVLSHKQTEQVKLEYLTSKRQEVENLINEQIMLIYEEFFKRQYEANYGVEEGEQKFQSKLAELVGALTKKVFQS